ncbi:RibD family protein [Microbacterium tumbae]
MSERPYVVLSCALSLDGYIDTATPPRLLLSNPADFDRVDELRAASDVILVGARTVRRDDPRLRVRSAARRRERVARSSSASPWKATITSSGDLDPRAAMFKDDVTTLVYCPRGVAEAVRRTLGHVATVVALGEEVSMAAVLDDLGRRGARRVLVEGGSTIHTQFLAGELVDELQLVMAPLFVGDGRAPRFVQDGRFAWDEHRRAALLEARPVGDVVLLRYALSERCAREDALAAVAQAVLR